jgi:hypothetical protein
MAEVAGLFSFFAFAMRALERCRFAVAVAVAVAGRAGVRVRRF